ncbi:MAG: hypothetical protein ACOCQG_01435, partial [Candidatus Nanoarchaeia archaeon]
MSEKRQEFNKKKQELKAEIQRAYLEKRMNNSNLSSGTFNRINEMYRKLPEGFIEEKTYLYDEILELFKSTLTCEGDEDLIEKTGFNEKPKKPNLIEIEKILDENKEPSIAIDNGKSSQTQTGLSSKMKSYMKYIFSTFFKNKEDKTPQPDSEKFSASANDSKKSPEINSKEQKDSENPDDENIKAPENEEIYTPISEKSDEEEDQYDQQKEGMIEEENKEPMTEKAQDENEVKKVSDLNEEPEETQHDEDTDDEKIKAPENEEIYTPISEKSDEEEDQY